MTWGTAGDVLIVSDTNNFALRSVAVSSGLVGTLAGIAGTSGHRDGVNTASLFTFISGVSCDSTCSRVALAEVYGHVRTMTAVPLLSRSGAYDISTFVGVGGTYGSTSEGSV